MARKLASIVRIVSVEPIEGADRIEKVKLLGWQCVTEKGRFQPGDLAVYIEVDAVPPDTEVYNWLWNKKGEVLPRPTSFRVRTMKLKSTLSQGVLLRLPEVGLTVLPEGTDVTEQLGITKYEPPVPEGSGEVRGSFPGFVSKTDETRAQAAPEVLDELRGKPWVATLKMDGTSSTFWYEQDEGLHCASRNLDVKDGPNLYWEAARKNDLARILHKQPELVIQGEIVGPGIQKNPAGLASKQLFVFSIYNRNTGAYFSDEKLRQFCERNQIAAVDKIADGEAFNETIDSLLKLAKGKYAGTTNDREGIVIRSKEPMHSTFVGGRLSFKVINNDFLLKEKD